MRSVSAPAAKPSRKAENSATAMVIEWSVASIQQASAGSERMGNVTSGAQKRSSSRPVMRRPAAIDRPNTAMTEAVSARVKPWAESIEGRCTSEPP